MVRFYRKLNFKSLKNVRFRARPSMFKNLSTPQIDAIFSGSVFDPFSGESLNLFAALAGELLQFLSYFHPIINPFSPNSRQIHTQFSSTYHPILVQFSPNPCRILTQFSPSSYPILIQISSTSSPILIYFSSNSKPTSTILNNHTNRI